MVVYLIRSVPGLFLDSGGGAVGLLSDSGFVWISDRICERVWEDDFSSLVGSEREGEKQKERIFPLGEREDSFSLFHSETERSGNV